MKASLALATAALAVLASAQERFTFNSSGTPMVGYHWKPTYREGRSRPGRPPFFQHTAPAIVIGHGLAVVQSSDSQPFAKRFAEEGYHAFTFDYRYWGESGGEPRNIVDLDKQQDDYRAAVQAARAFKGVDSNRIVIWGSSLSGGTVLNLGPSFYNDTSSGVVGVISQVPHTNGYATSQLTPQNTIPNLVELSIADTKRINTTQPPIYIPVANHTGQLGLLTQPGAYEGYEFIQPNPPGPEYNNIAARFVITLPFFSPDAIAAQSHLPTYVAIGLNDNIVSAPAAVNLTMKMPNATAYQYAGCGHFDVYPGKPCYKENIDNQVAFLKKNVPLQQSRFHR